MATWDPMVRGFLRLADDAWTLTSPEDNHYNCIAWAAGECHRVWWPSPSDLIYWPDDGGEPRLEIFLRGFGCIGYAECDAGDPEEGFEKVAIYVKDGEVQHMARLLSDGRWTSKMGVDDVDISHPRPESVGGGIYGEIAAFMKKRSV